MQLKLIFVGDLQEGQDLQKQKGRNQGDHVKWKKLFGDLLKDQSDSDICVE